MKKTLKRFSALIFIFAFLCSSVFSQSLSHQERVTAKNELKKAYNLFSTMEADEYTQMLQKGATQAREAGEVERARVLENLAQNPDSRKKIAEQIYQKIESESENGLFLAVYLWAPTYWCYYGDVFCIAMIAVLATATLDGEPAAQY